MTFEDLLPIIFLGIFAFFLVLERLFPAREQPRVRFWLAKGIAFFIVNFALNAALPALVMMKVGDYSVLHLRWLGTWGGAALMVLISDLCGYWIHRSLHNSQVVWRWTHQLHHSAERMDIAGAAYFHPFDTIIEGILPGVLLSIFLGLSPMAAAVGGAAGFVLGFAPHLNVRTPAWLGYLFQRPEMHAVHHLRGVHAYNYGVLALSDLLFGTWRNPAHFPEGEFGFWDGASRKVGRMLIGRPVQHPDR